MEANTLNLPVLALRGLTVFPHTNLTFDVERRISIKALEVAMESGQEIFLVTQRELNTDRPGEKDLYTMGTISRVTQILRLGKTSLRVMVEGGRRARLRRLWQTEPYLQGHVEVVEESAAVSHGPKTEALLRQTWGLFQDYAHLAGNVAEEVTAAVLDEIDKLSGDYRGDPASALLEALDSEQNHAFRDHFLEIPLDLSQVMFITTANSLDTIPRPLLDRMEVIQLSSYTDEEKLQIAKNHLLPKQMKEHGLKKGSLRIDEETLRAIIRDYTRESGVRQLERRLAAVCRKTDMQLLSKTVKRVTVTEKDLPKLLDMQPYPPTVHVEQEEIGVVNGLAWTEAGGEILEVEVNVMDGSGKLELTGNLGDVMKESAQAALSCLRSRAETLGIDPDFYKTKDIHVHFPEGAVPKDGPSAGIAMATALLSALTNRKIKAGIAMTGEVTLRGRVLPIGGLKEKTMAAKRYGIHTVLIPKDNARDLEEIDQTVRAALRFVPVETVDQVFAEVFCPSRVETKADAIPAFLPVENSKEAALRQ